MTTIVAAAVVVHEGRVLLTKRLADQHLAGMWEFPGGKLEPNEGPEEALVRECREECGIDVVVHDVLDVTFHRYPDKGILLLFYRCAWVAGEVQNLHVAEHAWVRPEELDDYALPPADVRVVAKVRGLV